MHKRTITYVLLVTILSCMLSGCYDRREVDELTYVIAIGLDKGTVEPLRLTLQYAVPKEVGGGSEGGGGGGGKSLAQLTLDAPSLIAGLNMANAFVGREVNLSHAVVVFFSEELAREDAGPYLRGMARWREFRPNIIIAVTRENAEEFLKSVKPIQEADPSKYYEELFSSYKYTGFIPNSQFFKFYTEAESSGRQPVAVLAGLAKYKSTKEFDPSLNTAKEKGKARPYEADFYAGDIPKVGDQKGEVMGLAVFDGSKMVGKMDGAQATNYLMTTGEYKNAFVTIDDPTVPGEVIVLSVSQWKKPETKVELAGNKPKISVKLSFEADFTSIQSGVNYEDNKQKPLIEKTASDYLKRGVSKFLELTAKEYHSDICGFGREARKQFLTWKEWEDSKWLSRYKDATFDVNVDVKIRRPGQIIRSAPFLPSDEKEISQ